MSGKNQPTPFKHFIKTNTQVNNINDVANKLAETFSANSSSTNSNTKFYKYKYKKEKQKLNFKSGITESCNKIFSLSERKKAIPKSHNTAVGSDEIHSEFLKHLSSES